MTEISLGKNGKSGSIDFSKIKNGIKKEELLNGVDSKLKSVFEQILNEIDTDSSDNMLSRKELEIFFNKIRELANKKDENNLSSGEAKEYQLADGSKLGKKGKDALFALLNKLSDLSKEAKITKNQDGSETNEYSDGRKETVFADGHKVVVTKNGKKAVTTTLDKDGNETEREETMESEDGSIVTISFKAGAKTKIVQKGNVKQHFSYDENAQDSWRLDSTTETTDDETVNTNYEYEEGHKKATETRRKKGQTEPHKTTTRTYDGENLVEEVVSESGQPQITKKVKSPQAHTETYTKDGATYTVEYSGKKPHSQTIVKDGTTYQVNYDEDEYTTGIIVQNGETIKSIADRFGVKPEDLVRANARLLQGKSYFNVGVEIRIPRKLQADEPALQGRKDSAGATAEYNTEMQRRAEQRRAEQAKIAKAHQAQQEEQVKKGKATTPNQPQQKAMKRKFTMKSGRYVTVENGTVKYYSANNVQLKKEYFIKKEGYDPVEMHPTGRYSVRIGKETTYYAKDGVQLKEAYFKKKESANVKTKGKTSLSNNGVRYVKSSDGKVRYYNASGAEITGSQRTAIVKAEAKLVAQILIEGTSYIGSTGLGTNEKKLEEGISKVYSPEIMAEVNNILKSKGYKSNNLITPIEDLFLSEVSRSEARGYIKALAKAGGYGVGAARDKAMGRNCAREIDWELHGGLTGYTGSKNLKEALNLADTRAARLETERIVGAKQTTCGKVKGQPDHGSWVRAYVAEDGWNSIEVDIFDMIWMKNGAYTHKEDQTHRNGLIRRAMTADNTPVGKKNQALVREARNTAYDAIEMGTADETTARQVAREENQSRRHKAQYNGQDELQTFIAGTNTDENGQVNAAKVAANNTNLYKSSKPAEVQAREILNYIDNGDYSHMFDSMEPEVYTKLNELTGNPNYVKFMYNKLIKTAEGNDKLKIMSNAILSKQIEFKKQELVDFCIQLMHSIDDNYGVGTSSGQSAGGINIAEYQTTQLQAILAQHPEILNDVKQRVAKEKFISKTNTYVSSSQYGARMEQTTETDRKGVYENLLNNTYTVDSKTKFYYENGEEITDSAVVDYIIKSQKDSLKDLRKFVAELEREFNKTVDSEGGLSDAANFLSEYTGMGTDRDDVRTRYRKAKLWLNQLEAAAEGKLRDSSGKPVSFQELAQKINAEVENLNSDYNTTISYGKMVAVMAPVLLVTLPVSAGAGALGTAVGLTTGVTNALVATTAATAAGGTTYLLNYAEMQTSVTGDTMEAREKNYLESSVAAFSTAIGVGQMKYICNMFKTAGAFAKAGGRLTTVLASDMGVAGVGEFIQSGTITKEGLTMTLFFSMTGNLIGIKSLTKNPAQKAMPKAEYTPPKGTNPEGIVPKNAKRLPDGTSQCVSSKDGVNMVDTYYYDADGNVIGQKTVINDKTSYLDANGHLVSEADFAKIKHIHDAKTPVLDRIDKNEAEGSVGKLSPENYAELQREVNYKLKNATTEAELDKLIKTIKKLYVRDQKRPLLQQIEAKRAKIQADTPQPKATEEPVEPVVKKQEGESIPEGMEQSAAAKKEEEGVVEQQEQVTGAKKETENVVEQQEEAVGAKEEGEGVVEQVEQSAGAKEEARIVIEDPQAKPYTEMNESELFSEYGALRNQVENASLSTPEKAAAIKKMNEIKKLLEAQGFEIKMDKYGREVMSEKSTTTADEPTSSQVEKENGVRFNKEDVNNFISEFTNIQNDPYSVVAELEKRGFVEIGGHTMEYPGNEFINMYNPKENIIYSFAYQNGKLFSKGKSYAIRNANGTYTRHSDIRVEYDGSGKPNAKTTNYNVEVASTGKAEGLSESYVLKKFGLSMKKLWTETKELIKSVRNKETYASAKSWIKSKFSGAKELFDDLMSLLEKQWAKVEFAHKKADSYTGSKCFDKQALEEFVNEPMTKSFTEVESDISSKGFKFIDRDGRIVDGNLIFLDQENYTGSLNAIDTNSGIRYSYEFENGKMVAKTQYSPQGERMTVHKLSNEEPYVEIFDTNDISLFSASSSKLKSAHYCVGGGQGGDVIWTEYRVNDINEIPDAIGVHLDKLPTDIRAEIVTTLKNGQDYSVTVKGKKYTFQINENNCITVSESIPSRSGSAARNREFARAYKQFNKEQDAVALDPREFHNDGTLKQDSQYALDTNNLPELRLIDGTIVDLNRADIKRAIMELQEGEFLTLGREGTFNVSSNMTVSGQHILITRHNGKIVMKDISRNGQTVCYTKKRKE